MLFTFPESIVVVWPSTICLIACSISIEIPNVLAKPLPDPIGIIPKVIFEFKIFLAT